MKKLRNLLCLALVIMIGCISFVGCNPDNDDPPTPPETTITLVEAKNMVVDSLKINNINQLGSINSLGTNEEINNRNIFAKLVASEFSITWDNDNPTLSGIVERNIVNWTKYDLQQSTYKEYYDGTNAYLVDGTEKRTSSFDSSMFGITLKSLDCIYVDLLFIDDAWVSIYNSEATKNIKDDEIVLTLDVNMPAYVDYVMGKASLMNLGAEGLFGSGDYLQRNKDEGSTELSVRFDKNLNIKGLTLSVNSLADSGGDIYFVKTTITINKFNQEFTQPNWFNASDFE